MFLLKNKAGNAFIEASTESMKKELEEKGFTEVKPEEKAPKGEKDKAPKGE